MLILILNYHLLIYTKINNMKTTTVLLSSLTISCSFLLSNCNNQYEIPIEEFSIPKENNKQAYDYYTDSTIMPLVKDWPDYVVEVPITRNGTKEYYELKEELEQLANIPFLLQVQGNSNDNQFLSIVDKGKELTIKPLDKSDLRQQFYLTIPPMSIGIPYLMYSKKTNTLIRLGSYTHAPKEKILYTGLGTEESLFGASWEIKRAKYSSNSYIFENKDYPRTIDDNKPWKVYYSVISVNGEKIFIDRYNETPTQEFHIIPVEPFKMEKIEFITDGTAIVSKIPETLYSDRFTNNGPLPQNHTFTISETYKETSVFTKKTSYNLNLSTEFKAKVPFIASGSIKTSISAGQEFSYGKNEEHSKTITRNYPIQVPANYRAEMSLTLYKYQMEVDYVATCVGLTSGKRILLKGRWSGVDVQETDAVLNLTPLTSTMGKAISIPISSLALKNIKPIKIKVR